MKTEFTVITPEVIKSMSEVKAKLAKDKGTYLKQCLAASMSSRKYDCVDMIVDIDRHGREVTSSDKGIKLSQIGNECLWVLYDQNDPYKLVEVIMSLYLDHGMHDETIKTGINPISPDVAMLKYDLGECTHSLYDAAEKGTQEGIKQLIAVQKEDLFRLKQLAPELQDLPELEGLDDPNDQNTN